MIIKCPFCTETELKKVMTEQGVIVEYCSQCKGIWLEKGEIFLFARDSKSIKAEIERGLQEKLPSAYVSPKTHEQMIKIPLLNNALMAHYCATTQGIWIDETELVKLNSFPQKGFSLSIDRKSYERLQLHDSHQKETAGKQRIMMPVGFLSLPNLVVRSSTVLFFLYGILTLCLITLVEFTALPPHIALLIGIAIAAFQFFLSPFIMDFSLEWFYKMTWTSLSELPPHLKDFIIKTCKKNTMKNPRIGLIHDGAPNAFTYGHHPNNARIVITQGILDLLNEDEADAVVAHEIGHAKHWDMLIMTVAQLVPLLLYYLYRTLISIRTKKDDKSGPYRLIIAIGAYILYIISEYLVLWLSRTREYYADRFAGETMENPNLLASALVKIGYGLAGQEQQEQQGKKGESRKRDMKLEAVGALGIFDAHTARSLAVTGYHKTGSMGGEIDKENLKGAMRWDLWNPWAKYYEIHSTHPLIANRLRYLSNQSMYKGMEPYILFDEAKPESYWDEFFVDLFVKFSPLLVILTFGGLYFTNPHGPFLGIGLFLLGISYLYQITFSYKNNSFPEMNVASLLKNVKVSSVRPVPCTVKGKVIGRGVPGLIWSEDFVLQDASGIIFLDYKQPLRLWELLFAIFRRESIQNQEVTIKGWYRRSPIPYIELKTLRTPFKVRTCYVYHLKIATAIILSIVGLFVMLSLL